jgi:uncharacterized protein YndB with AHSA1/START domain
MSDRSTVKPSLTLKRRLKAPPERVFAAWTDPEKMKRWMGAPEIEILKAEADARVGGRYRIEMRDTAGGPHNVGGVYREVVVNEKLVFTWQWEATPPEQPHESLVTVLIKPDGDGTLLTLTHERLSSEESSKSHEQGWISSLDKLERLTAGASPA